jgi:hypothetical protein
MASDQELPEGTVQNILKLWEYDNSLHGLLETNLLDSHFIGSSVSSPKLIMEKNK